MVSSILQVELENAEFKSLEKGGEGDYLGRVGDFVVHVRKLNGLWRLSKHYGNNPSINLYWAFNGQGRIEFIASRIVGQQTNNLNLLLEKASDDAEFWNCAEFEMHLPEEELKYINRKVEEMLKSEYLSGAVHQILYYGHVFAHTLDSAVRQRQIFNVTTAGMQFRLYPGQRPLTEIVENEEAKEAIHFAGNLFPRLYILNLPTDRHAGLARVKYYPFDRTRKRF
jgi:hypothetical protein